MPLNTRQIAAACLIVAAVFTATACGTNDDDSPGPSTGAPSDIGKIPDPIGDPTSFLSAMDAAGGCSDALVSGITDTIGAMDKYAANPTGTAKVSAHSGSSIAGVPACTFTIDAGNTEFPTKVIVAGLPQSQNSILTSPTPTMADGYTTDLDKPCPFVGSDKVAAAAVSVLNDNGLAKLTCADNTSATNLISVDTADLTITGRAGYSTAENGWFVAAISPNAPRTGLTSNMSGVIANWFDRESQPGNATQYTDGS